MTDIISIGVTNTETVSVGISSSGQIISVVVGIPGPPGPPGTVETLSTDFDLHGHEITDSTRPKIVLDPAKDAEVGAVTYEKLVSVALNDDQSTPFQFYTFDVATTGCAILQYSAKRGLDKLGHGTLMVSTNGTAVTLTDFGGDLSLTLGIAFSASIVNTTVALLYTTTSIGASGTIAFKAERWLF